MRIKAYDTDGKYLDIGTITKVETLEIEYEDGTLQRVSDNYPAKIKLDNGEIREGLDCWWMPLEFIPEEE
jgi:hypothetical protein